MIDLFVMCVPIIVFFVFEFGFLLIMILYNV